MQQPPRPPDESIFARRMGWRILLTGTWMAVICLLIQYLLSQQLYDEKTQQSFVFTLLCIGQLGNAIAIRSHQSLFRRRGEYFNWRLWTAIGFIVLLQAIILFAPFAQYIFRTKPLSPELLAYLAGGLVLMIAGFEVIRFVTREKSRE